MAEDRPVVVPWRTPLDMDPLRDSTVGSVLAEADGPYILWLDQRGPAKPDMTQVAPDQLTIRVMTRHDLDLAIDWAAAEGWNPGLKDAGCFQASDPTGFMVGCLGDEPIASISVVRYSKAF